MSYFIMESPVGPGNKRAHFLPYSNSNCSWMSGSKIVDLPPEPIELKWDPENENETRKAYYESGVVLMLKDLVSAFCEAGVDNLDVYPVLISSTTSKEICNDYVAVNVIGKIAAADMEKSEIIDEGMGAGMIDVIFNSLVIDEEKAHGKLLFRLAESVGAVVVHEKVVFHVLSKGDFGLTFTKPEEFCG